MSDAIFSSYLCLRDHPQKADPEVQKHLTNGKVPADSFDYIKEWVTTLPLGVQGVLFTDGLSPDFRQFLSDKHGLIVLDFTEASDWSNNDVRFFRYLDFLEHDPRATAFDRIFITDARDLIFNRNPFELLDESPDALVMGDERLSEKTEKLRYLKFTDISRRYLRFHRERGWERPEYFDEQDFDLLNCGVVGGSQATVLEFLRHYREIRVNVGNPEWNLNTPVTNYIAWNFFESRLRYGFPITSDFFGYEQPGTSPCYILHK